LERIISKPLLHFCYPSGVYGRHHAEWLAALGLTSATTIDPGLNYRDTSPFALRRVVDGEPVSDIELEAEMAGFMELVRAVRGKRLFSRLTRAVHGARRRDHVEEVRGERGADFYDRVHAETDNLHSHSIFYPLFREVANNIRQHGSRSILEVGCG